MATLRSNLLPSPSKSVQVRPSTDLKWKPLEAFGLLFIAFMVVTLKSNDFFVNHILHSNGTKLNFKQIHMKITSTTLSYPDHEVPSTLNLKAMQRYTHL